jgi:hypothetical protein
MATLARPKHGSTDSYRTRNARWRHNRSLEAPEPPKFKQTKPRDLCKPSPDGLHVFCEYMQTWSYVDSEGVKKIQFTLSCCYCKRKAYYENVPYEQLVKWVRTPATRKVAA